MRAYETKIVGGVLAALVALAGCGGDEDKGGNHQIWFMGAVFNGATGERVTDYHIRLVYGGHEVAGTVDENGRYDLGPLPAWNDYGVVITATGFRAFSSYNAFIAPPSPPTPAGGAGATAVVNADVYRANTTQTKDFDAYVFPDDLQAPAVSITVLESGLNAMPAAGSIRLQPTSQPSIQSAQSEVAGQVWANDEDILAAVINDSFTGGSYQVAASTLLYGVSYGVQIYGVDGYQPGMATFQAGFQNGLTLNLMPQTVSPLQRISTMPMTCAVARAASSGATAMMVFTFNQPIEDGTMAIGTVSGAEVLDDGIAVQTTNFIGLAADASPTASEHGSTFTIPANGSTLTISWNPSVGLASQVANDMIVSMYYSGLSSIYLQPKGHPELRTLLSTLLGSAQISCTPQ